ncbi:MAG: PQQ-binding-like beta-propeller repeat protein [Planctomycetaceae bacterium]|nr:PQQ-binding-like beta-propeller repeat protein [Planctomycetaceae bacterium]
MQIRFFQSIALMLILTLFASFCFANDDFRILFLTDTHVTPGNDGEKGLIAVGDEVNHDKERYDYLVMTGDLTNMGSDDELLCFKKCLDRIDVEKKYVIPGNHESCWSESACQTLIKLWGNDRFEFKHGDFYCIAFSTGPYMKMADGHVKAEDLRWLDKKLRENASDPQTKVLVFTHYPLNTGLDNWFEVTSILKKYNVIAAFCGHGHNLRRYNNDGIPGFMGRPTLFGGDPVPGYNIIEIKGDQISLIARKCGEPEGEPFTTFTMGDPSIIEGLACDPFPILEDGELPEDVSVTEMRTDEASIFGGIAIDDQNIYYGNSIGIFKACKIQTNGTLEDRWQFLLKGSIYSTPALADGLVVVGSSDNEIIALDVNDGSKVWSLITKFPVTSDPVIVDGAVYVGLGKNEFCKIDLKTGQKLWSYTGVNGRFQGAPAIAHGMAVFGAWNEHLYALDAETGKELWIWRGTNPGSLYSPGNVIPVVSESQVVIVAPDRHMTAIDRKTGKQIWRTNKYSVRESMGTSCDGSIAYAKTMKGHVIAVSSVSEKFSLLWDCETGVEYDHVACPLFLHKKALFYGSPLGVVAAIDTETGKKLWSYKRGNSSINRFISDNHGRVWYTMIEGKIYCIGDSSQNKK